MSSAPVPSAKQPKPTTTAPPRVAPPVDEADEGGSPWAAAWQAALGRSWRLELALLGLVCVMAGALRPLWDADLPMHLATGEWIARHRAVPVTEPFAWTIRGAPFYAIGWGAQLLFYLVMAVAGPLGLRLLDGVLVACAAAAVLALGRSLRWSPAASLILAAGNVLIAATVTVGLRPQLLVFTYVPLAWACTALLGTERRIPAAIGLFGVSALAVNTHLYFPLVLAPLPALWALDRLSLRWAAVGCLAVLAGWLVTPYVLHWPDMLRFQLAPYPVFRQPASISELQPGFVAAVSSGPTIWIALLPLLALPWIVLPAMRSTRARLGLAAYWSVGLVAFGYAQRLIGPWWLIVFPFYAEAMRAPALHVGQDRPARPAVKLVAYGGMLALVGTMFGTSVAAWSREGSVASRRLSTKTARLVEPLAEWLSARTAPDAGGRILTIFDFGSYLTWRLPRYSASVDSRGSFPDSVIAPELLQYAWRTDAPLGPWSEADLAIVPTRWRVAAVLDTAAGWRRAATAVDAARAPRVGIQPDSVGLWVHESWWARVGGAPLLGRPVVLRVDGDGVAHETRAVAPTR
jgi:hypothetical protein